MNIGFYLLNINSENPNHTKILSAINSLCDLRPYDNIVLFNDRFNIVDNNAKYYTLHISEAKYFKGVLFLFDMKSALLTRTFPSPSKQMLFMLEPEWTNNTRFPYTFWHNIYMRDNIELISTNKTTDDLSKICWKNPIAQIEDFNPQGIDDVLQKL